MIDSSATHCEAELVPLCLLPCSIRFAIWCFRVAKLSARGSELARLRLQEIHRLLQKPDAAAALERCIGLLLENARQTLDIREFGLGSVYSSQTELNLLTALGALQAGDVTLARRVLGGIVTARLAGVVEAATTWTAQIKEAGVLLPR
jgi:hypothetical protein